MASHNETLRDDDIDAIAAKHNDSKDVDAFGQWHSILSECGYEDDNVYETANRTTIMSTMMCGENGDDSQYFVQTYIRKGDWKLLLNHTKECPEFPRPYAVLQQPAFPYWINHNNTYLETPNFDVYDDYMNNEELKDLFQSKCVDEMPQDERNKNNTLFWYDEEVMLFKISDDPIEAVESLFYKLSMQ